MRFIPKLAHYAVDWVLNNTEELQRDDLDIRIFGLRCVATLQQKLIRIDEQAHAAGLRAMLSALAPENAAFIILYLAVLGGSKIGNVQLSNNNNTVHSI